MLTPGKRAPAFKGKDQNGETFLLKDLAGSKVILYFYPHSDTPTSTAQACDLRDNYDKLKNAGYRIVGISTDTVVKQEKFVRKYDLPFTIIADKDLSISKKYGVWGQKKFMGRAFDGTHRTTFIIDEEGLIRHVLTGAGKNHAAVKILALEF